MTQPLTDYIAELTPATVTDAHVSIAATAMVMAVWHDHFRMARELRRLPLDALRDVALAAEMLAAKANALWVQGVTAAAVLAPDEGVAGCPNI